MKKTPQAILSEDIHTVIMGLGDLNGLMRGKRFPATRWEEIAKNGATFSTALFAVDMTCEAWDTPFFNFDTGYPDFHMFPLKAPVAVPWEPGVAIALGRAEAMDCKALPIDPRQVLLRQLARAFDMGIEINVGAELEFYLLDPQTKAPCSSAIGMYSLDIAAELEHVIGPIRRDLHALGFPIEQSNPEYGPGQVEVNLRYGPALDAADQVVLFRSLIRQIAKKHGLLATFMAKPFWDYSGNGFHCHYSLWRDGQNILGDGGQLNETGRHFIGGLQKRMAESALCASTTVNAFRRRRHNSFCPINASWGIDNRTFGLRVIDGSQAALRVEKRDASADCNPYFLLASDIAAGLDGIEKKIEPTPMTTGSGYNDKTAPPLPCSLDHAVSLARGSQWLQNLLGDVQYEILLQQSERELDFFARQVTPVEMERYLENF